MRRCLIFGTIALAVLTPTTGAKAQEPHVRERARQYEPLMAAAAARHGVDPRLLWAIAYQETRFRPALISPKGARGLMQFMPATAIRYGLVDAHDPAQAIDAAARYVRDLSRRFNGDIRLVLAAYNSGEGTVEAYRDGRRLVLPNGKIINPGLLKTGGVPPYGETQRYVAGGTAIYRNINPTGIFSATRRAPALATTPLSPPPVKIAPEESKCSLYMNSAEASTNSAVYQKDQPTNPLPSVLPDSPTVPRAERTRSIYIP